jgi:hypothetical protein
LHITSEDSDRGSLKLPYSTVGGHYRGAGKNSSNNQSENDTKESRLRFNSDGISDVMSEENLRLALD